MLFRSWIGSYGGPAIGDQILHPFGERRDGGFVTKKFVFESGSRISDRIEAVAARRTLELVGDATERSDVLFHEGLSNRVDPAPEFIHEEHDEILKVRIRFEVTVNR